SARRELFDGAVGGAALAINSLDWDWKKHPVIRLDLNAGDYRLGVSILDSMIKMYLDFAAEKYGVELTGDNNADRFSRLIKNLHDKFGERVVVIIDEYDKPLLETIDAPEKHRELRSALKSFYGVLKPADEHLRFVFITGVTKFAQVSIFSDLNHLKDLTLDPRYADLCGWTQEEVEANFAPEIDLCAAETDRATYLARLKNFYNGYRFSEKKLTVYNPFGLLLHFDSAGKFSSYWYNTGTPTFLLKLINEQKIDILKLEHWRVDESSFQKFDIANLNATVVLYQSGYLTIRDYDAAEAEFILDYPNEEVRASFADALIEGVLRVETNERRAFLSRFVRAILHGEPTTAMELLPPFFASIPHEIIVKKEHYYQTVVHLIFTMLGFHCHSEVHQAIGSVDTLVETRDFVYCFEFKLNGTVAKALAQIDEKEYLLPYRGSGRKLFKIGAVFKQTKRNLGAWKVVEA
ncbi:MAG: ATP-binding protein, partial [Planctomycetota bacterium]|nr:ATP-binding protein [Planctomycetota bacterium]